MYYLKVKPAEKLTEQEEKELVSLAKKQKYLIEKEKNPQTKLTPDTIELTDQELSNVMTNVNSSFTRCGTLKAISALIEGYSPKMKSFSNQTKWFKLSLKLDQHDSKKLNYIELSNEEGLFLKDVLNHENYHITTATGTSPLKGVSSYLVDVEEMPNVKPSDYEVNTDQSLEEPSSQS